jgi:hypothetical protein
MMKKNLMIIKMKNYNLKKKTKKKRIIKMHKWRRYQQKMLLSLDNKYLEIKKEVKRVLLH